MGPPVRGDVVVVPFPFSDLSEAKRRPALVLADLAGNEVILCQITSRDRGDALAVALGDEAFAEGSLRRRSYVRPGRIFTADERIVLYRAGHLEEATTRIVVDRVVGLLGA